MTKTQVTTHIASYLNQGSHLHAHELFILLFPHNSSLIYTSIRFTLMSESNCKIYMMHLPIHVHKPLLVSWRSCSRSWIDRERSSQIVCTWQWEFCVCISQVCAVLFQLCITYWIFVLENIFMTEMNECPFQLDFKNSFSLIFSWKISKYCYYLYEKFR